MKLIGELARLPPRTIVAVAASHALLLLAIGIGGLSYLILQFTLASELLVVSLATIPLYRERGWRRHLFDLLKLTGTLVFLLFFVLVTYGVARVGEDGEALGVALQALGDRSGLGWALLYVVVHVGIGWWLARATPQPRLTWARNALAEGGTTFVAMLLMIFVAAFAGAPLAGWLRSVGVDVDVDLLLGCGMVLVRFFFALVMATMSPREMQAMAANPYVD